MATQLRLDDFKARLLARRTDPETSKEAARKIAVRLTENQEQALWILNTYGPGTTHELANWTARVRGIESSTAIHHGLARRLPELARKRKAEVVQDPTKLCRCKLGAFRCHCRDMVRDGCRVWRAVKEE